MKIKNVLFLAILLMVTVFVNAQDAVTSKKIFYKYTFEGMKDSSEVYALEKSVLQLKNVASSNVIFKSAEHTYALLKVEVLVPESFNENSVDVTGPSDLKKILSRLGYTPAECKTSYEN